MIKCRHYNDLNCSSYVMPEKSSQPFTNVYSNKEFIKLHFLHVAASVREISEIVTFWLAMFLHFAMLLTC